MLLGKKVRVPDIRSAFVKVGTCEEAKVAVRNGSTAWAVVQTSDVPAGTVFKPVKEQFREALPMLGTVSHGAGAHGPTWLK